MGNWQNRFMVLFEIEEDVDWPTYLGMLGVFRIMWFGQSCQRIILRGMMPYHWDLFKSEDEHTFHLVLMPPGAIPDVYHEGKPVAIFKHCTFRRRWINRPVAVCPDETDYVWGYMELDCDIELLDRDLWEEY